MTGLKFDILHVDDDEVDRKAVQRALRARGVDCKLINASDGVEALEILGKQYGQPGANPFIILLDINMPRMNGIEFLERLRGDSSDPSMKNAVVFVLTTSRAEIDLQRAYGHIIAGYMVKGDYKEGLSAIVDFLEAYGKVTVFP